MSRSNITVNLAIENFTVGEITENNNGLRIDLNTLTMDMKLMDKSVNAGFGKTMQNFYDGKNISDPKLYKISYFSIKGLKKEPKIVVYGDNGAVATTVFEDGAAKIYIKSNGRTVTHITY